MPSSSSSPARVLILCTGNSARSILAEYLINARSGGRLEAASAGSRPRGEVHPMALQLLAEHGISTAGARSKSWEEFAGAYAPPFDLVITVCDNAAGEECPIWPGHPLTAHWGIDDPAAVAGAGEHAAFERAFQLLDLRIAALLALPFESLDPAALKGKLREIGSLEGASTGAATL